MCVNVVKVPLNRGAVFQQSFRETIISSSNYCVKCAFPVHSLTKLEHVCVFNIDLLYDETK